MILKKEMNFNEIIQGEKVLVDFFATWCGPCKMIAPVLEKFAAAHPEITVIKVDVDEFPKIANEYGIRSIPTLIHFSKGEIVEQKLGFMDLNKLESWLA